MSNANAQILTMTMTGKDVNRKSKEGNETNKTPGIKWWVNFRFREVMR